MRTLKVKSISVMLIFSMMLAMFMPLFPVKVYAESDTRTQITRINLNVVSGTAVAEYGETVAHPNLEIVSTEPASAKDYLSVDSALWYKGGSWVPSGTFGEGEYYLLVSINLSNTSQYKFDSPTDIMYINGTQLNSSAVGTNYIRNDLRYNLESPSGTAPTITTTSLSAGNIGDEYSATLTATGTKPITWSLKSGSSLPSGLNLTSNGVISGTPTVSGDYDFTVVATNSAGSVEKNLSLKIKNLQKITRINLNVVSGTAVAKYGETVAHPNLEIVSTEPASAKDYLSVDSALWYKGGSWVPSGTFGEGEYYLQIKIDLSGTGQGLYKWADDTEIMYLDGTRLSSSSVGDSYLINRLEYTVSSTATTHTVRFISNGGTSVTQQEVIHGETATEPSEPTRSGHSFAGWYSDSTLLTPFDFSTPIKNNTFIYAKWNVARNVTFDLNGGTWTDAGTNPQVVNEGQKATKPDDPTKDGYDFKGWTLNGSAYDFNSAVNGNITLVASWEAIEYNVTVTGGTASVGAGTPITKATMGTTVTLTAGAAPSGQMFDKWVVNGVVVADANSATTTFTMPAGNVTATATYKNIPVVTYTVTFDANGGTGNMAAANGISGNYTLPPNGFTPPANKQFKCWSVNDTEKNPFETISVTENVTVKAVWKDIAITSYTVSFDSNGGSGSMASVTNAPSLYTLPANGFTPPANKQFKCWAVGAQNDEYDPGDKITITANVTVKAVWEAITSSRQVISDVVATSSDLDTIPTLYGLLKMPTFNITQGAPAYINASTSNLRWQKKVGGVWTNQDSGRFTPGEWRITSSLRIDGTDGYYYELGNPTTLKVNGVEWIVENGGKPSVHPDYSHANILSPVFTIVDDPNVQPPVSVPSVHMVLKGYEKGALISAASVQTDAMVDADVLGFLKLVDSNGDEVPEPEVAGNNDVFEEGVLYAVAISLHAKDGYDISGLTPATVSLDRSLMDSVEEFVEDDETFSGIYLLDDINQWTVKFETNGGSGTMTPATGISGEYTLPANGFTAPEGKQFKAWSVNGSEKAVGDKITVTANTTVTAVWEDIPAGHTCDIKPVEKVKPSCTEGGKEAYYKCEGCGKFYEDALGAKEITDLAAWGNLDKLGHTESGWKSDKDNHWKECTVAGCGVIIENSKAAHKDDNNDGKCDVCEYNVGTANKPSDDVQSPQTGDNSMMWLWVALLFVSGFGVVATTVYGKRRTARK